MFNVVKTRYIRQLDSSRVREVRVHKIALITVNQCYYSLAVVVLGIVFREVMYQQDRLMWTNFAVVV